MVDSSELLVLITDLSTRKSFDLANILRKRGIQILLGDAVEGAANLILSKAYGEPIEMLRKDSRFVDDLRTILKKYHARKIVYIPVEEDTTLLVYDFMQRHRYQNFYTSLPPKRSFDTVRDKGEFSEFCQAHHIPVPKRYECKALQRAGRLPCRLIFKPKSGSGSVGIFFADEMKDVDRLCERLDMQRYIIQQRLEHPKEVEGAFFLCREGKVLSYYGHKRIRTYPPGGGVSIYSKCEINPRLQALGADLLQKLQWTGLAMVEFLYDHANEEYKVIEVNPRLWGSLMLSECCGSRMLENYCLSALEMPIMQEDIREDRYIRWFFPWEVLLYIQLRGRIEGFWKWKRDKTCYINFSYSSIGRSLTFLFYNMLNPQKLKRLLQKVTGR